MASVFPIFIQGMRLVHGYISKSKDDTMKTFLIFLSYSLLTCSALGQINYGALRGTFYEVETKTPIIPFVIVIAKCDSTEIRTATDFDGRFAFNALKPGHYSITTKVVGMTDHVFEADILPNEITFLDPLFLAYHRPCDPMPKPKTPLIDPFNPQRVIISGKQIRNMPY